MIMLTIKPIQGDCLVWRAFGGCVIAAFMIFSVSAVHAREKEPRYDLHISQAKLGDALNELARQMGMQLLFPFDLVQTQEANPVSGQYTVTEALDILLRGTGFSGGLTESGVITVSQSPPVDRQNQEDAMLLKGKKRSLLSSVSALIVGVFGTADVNAQNGQVTNTSIGVPEIVVTTRKREENLQQVPIAITAFTAVDIRDAGIQSIDDIALLTPGFTISPLFGQSGAVTPVIRGLSQTIGETNVGFFIDGVYQSSRATMESLLGDNIERIEIAKGPQSALYGRNTFGGAINYISKPPGDEFEASAEVTYGRDEEFDIRASVGGPIIADRLFFRAGFTHHEKDGYFTNELTGGTLDDRNSEIYTGTLRATPNDDIDIRFNIGFENTNDGDDPLVFATNNIRPADLFGVGLLVPQVFGGELPNPRGGFAFTPGYLNRDNLSMSLSVDWDLGAVTVTSITGYNDLDLDDLTDDDYEARVIHETLVIKDLQEFSQELRIASNGDGRFNWMLGGYYYDLDEKTITDGRNVGLGAALETTLAGFMLPFFGTSSFASDVTEKTKSYAVFGQAGADVTEQLAFTFSGRFTHEKKSVNSVDSAGVFVDSDTFNSFTPRVSLDYQVTDDAMVYFSAAKAIKSGGFNVVSGLGSIADSERTYGKEKSWNYELGAKTSWFDNRMTFNVTGYYISWKDQIVRALGSTFVPLNINAGETTSHGVEIEMAAQPLEGLDLRAGFAYTDAEYEDFDFTTLLLVGFDPAETQLAGTRLQYVSKYTANGTVQYRTPVTNDINWFNRFDVMYQTDQSAVQTADAFTGDRTLVNLKTGFEMERVSVTFSVDNVFNNRVANNGVFVPNPARRFDFANGFPTILGVPGFGPAVGFEAFGGLVHASPPRVWGVTIRAHY